MRLANHAGCLSLIGVLALLYTPVGRAHARGDDDATARRIPAEFVEAVRSASRIAGVRFSSLMAQLARESDFQPDARNPASSATGPAQFLEGTWLTMIRRYGAAYGLGHAARSVSEATGRPDIQDPTLKAEVLALRQVPQLAAIMAARYLASVASDMHRLLGRRPTAAEARMGYLLGAGGAAQLLRAARRTPSRPAREILPDAALANPTLFSDPDGTPRSVEVCVNVLRQTLSDDEAWSQGLEPRSGHERIGDMVHTAAPVG